MKFVDVTGVRVSAIGLGCWQFGSKDWGYGDHYAQDTAVGIVRTALDLGITLIDTAEAYARGVSETVVGRAIAGRRDDVFVATKMTPAMPTAAAVEDHGRLSALRLQVDCIDLYQLHWPNPVVPLANQMAGMRRLLDHKLVANVGVSNYPAKRWAAAERALGTPVISNQVQYSLLWRRAERSTGTVRYAQTHDRLIIAYSPLAKGLLGGRYSPDNMPTNSARTLDPLFVKDNVERAMPVVDTVKRVANAHDATPAQVALAWLIAQPNVVAIPGASSVEQLRRNAEAADLDLTADDLAELTAASDAFTPLAPPQAALALLRSSRRGEDADN